MTLLCHHTLPPHRTGEITWIGTSEENDLLFVITDNQPVTRSYHKASSKHRSVDEDIGSVRCIIRKRQVIYIDVDSEDNYGDIGSRPDEHCSATDREHRRRRSIAFFIAATKEYDADERTLRMRSTGNENRPMNEDDERFKDWIHDATDSDEDETPGERKQRVR